MSDDERRATAYHEAGHTVMSFICGRVPSSVDIIPDAYGNAGHTHFSDNVPSKYKRYLDKSPEKRRYLEMRILIALAGTAAHDVMCPGREHDCGDLRDKQQAKALLSNSIIFDDERDAALSRLKTKAQKKISESWFKVETVASMLLRQSRVSGNEIQSLLQDNSGQP